MIRRFFSLIAIGCLLSSCASTPPPVYGSIGWHEHRRALVKPVRHKPHVVKESSSKPDPNVESAKPLADLRPYSVEWWAMRDQIDADEQRRLNAKLLICRGCLPTPDDPDDLTASTSSRTKK